MDSFQIFTKGISRVVDTQFENYEASPGVVRSRLATNVSQSVVTRTEKKRTVFIDQGGDFKTPTPHRYFVEYEDHGYGSVGYYQSDGTSTVYSSPGLAGFPSYLEASEDIAYNNAVESLNSQVRSGVNLAVDLAESHQAIRMIRAVTKLRKFARSLRDLPGTWLQYQYGWRPLVGTIYDAGGILSRQLANRAQKGFRARGTDSVESTLRVRQNSNVWDSDHCLSQRRCEIRVQLDLSADFTRTLADYTSLDPRVLAWEMLPYSFVVDWVVDIGGYLSALETSRLWSDSYRSGSVSFGHFNLSERKRSYFGRTAPNQTVAGSATSMRYQKYFDRRILGSYPAPRFPTPHISMGASRFLSAASLLAVAFRR